MSSYIGWIVDFGYGFENFVDSFFVNGVGVVDDLWDGLLGYFGSCGDIIYWGVRWFLMLLFGYIIVFVG